MQWPVKPNASAKHFTMDFAESYASYLQAGPGVSTPRFLRGGVGCADSKCLWLIGTSILPGALVALRGEAGEILQDEGAPARRELSVGETLLTVRVLRALPAFRSTGVFASIVNPDGTTSNSEKFVKPAAQ